MSGLAPEKRDEIRGMIASNDTESIKTIAEMMECSEEEVQALAKPKAALSGFMFFCNDMRDAVSAELGTSATHIIAKALGERWAAQTERTRWEEMALKDKQRHDVEMADYDRRLQREIDEERRSKEAAAAGPSDREVARAEKRALMQEEANTRIEAPKQPKKARVLTDTEKQLEAQNKAIKDDMAAAAKQRLGFLLGQSDLFRHFGIAKEADTSKKKAKKGRKTEKEEDEEMMAENDEAAGSTGGGGVTFEEKLRVSSQPGLINTEHGSLRPYQVAGLNWLANLYQNGINGILADEMGLGKTLQTISLLCWLRETKGYRAPFLVLAPKSTLRNWVREFANWAPCFKVLHFHGDKDERQAMIDTQLQPDGFDVCITSYEMVIREANAFRKFTWRYLIIDEAHRMKNEESKLSQVLRSFSSHSRLLITGTPMQNNLHELWALLNFLLPDIFNSADDFDSWFDMKDKRVEQEVISQLHKVLRPFLLRRVKTEVEGSIPPKSELIIYTQLSAMQKEQYKNILKRDMDALYQSSGAALTANKGRLLNLVMQLRKCCNHPYLFEGAEDKTLDPFGDHLVTNSGKMRVLDKLLLRVKAQGSRVLIFSQMTRILDILEDYCAYRRNEGFTYCRIDGSTGGEDRQDAIDAYNAPNSDRFIFLLSTRAGGLGINLQTADIVIIFDSDWNPQADLQAMDRAHRIGQKKEVKVFRFVTQDSIEEKVTERAELKLQMDFAVIQQGRLAEKQKALTKEEALAAVRYGADKVFKSEGEEITDTDIDTLLASAKNLTKEREEASKALADKEKRDLLDFSDANVNFQEFEGVDYKALAQHGDMEFMELMQDSIGKRERTGTSYNEKDFYRGQVQTTKTVTVDKTLPKQKKMPEMKDFQLFSKERIAELYELEHSRELKRAKAMQRAAEAGGPEPDMTPTEQELSELKEREGLEAQGFSDWQRSEYIKFIKACEKHGREQLQQITDEVGTKTLDEVKIYSAAFWSRGAGAIPDFEKILKRVEEGERKITEKAKMAEALKTKVNSTENPWQSLAIKYGNNRGKLFTEDEDRFLVCMTNELGYGKWDDLKREVRRCPEFRFDWLFKSRTPIELGRRVDLLIRLIQNESKEPGPRQSKKAAAAQAASSHAEE
jgi:SWI/SNF-related matrix-associated actin-dependent regulator of chromatin subfamily A member 5